MSTDRTLFFAPNGKPGFGGYDLYRSEFENGQWTEPVNFGFPVKQPRRSVFTFYYGGRTTWIYSHEDNQKLNSSEIVEINVPEELQLRYKSNYVKGVIRDKKTKLPLKARVEIIQH